VDQWLFGSKLQASFTSFYTKLQETVQFVTFAPGDPFSRPFGYANGGGGIARGVELSGRVSPTSRTTLQAAYTFTNSASTLPTIGRNFYKTLGLSDHMLNLSGTQWFARRFSATVDFYALSNYSLQLLFGRQYVFDPPVRADLVIHYDLPVRNDKTVELYTKIENVTNKRAYEDGFVGPKAWMIAGVRWKY
jgi:outer membrane receptor protein involved in Fe transport